MYKFRFLLFFPLGSRISLIAIVFGCFLFSLSLFPFVGVFSSFWMCGLLLFWHWSSSFIVIIAFPVLELYKLHTATGLYCRYLLPLFPSALVVCVWCLRLHSQLHSVSFFFTLTRMACTSPYLAHSAVLASGTTFFARRYRSDLRFPRSHLI